MKLERLTLIPSTVNADSDGRQQSVNGADDGNKVARLPRWTRQEILVLIQGKKVAENRIRRGRTGGLEIGGVEPKWASVSSYCKRHGVNRGPVQCRKRWSNLAGDFKKIKEWEIQIKEETESFWVMRNDLRREKKLPGFFDREVYDILDRGSGGGNEIENCEEQGLVLALGSSQVLFDSGKSGGKSGGGGGGGGGDDGLFSDFEQVHDEAGSIPHKDFPPINDSAPTPISEQQHQPLSQEFPTQGTSDQKQPTREPDIGSGQEGRKRKRNDSDTDEEASNLQHHLVRALERNGKMVSSQLEAQNMHFQQDREQRKDHVDNLVAVLSKLADALGRIADKL